MKLYELLLRDRSGRAGRFRSLKFLSRAVIFDMLNLVHGLACVLILVLSGTERGQAQDARAQYRGPGPTTHMIEAFPTN